MFNIKKKKFRIKEEQEKKRVSWRLMKVWRKLLFLIMLFMH